MPIRRWKFLSRHYPDGPEDPLPIPALPEDSSGLDPRILMWRRSVRFGEQARVTFVVWVEQQLPYPESEKWSK